MTADFALSPAAIATLAAHQMALSALACMGLHRAWLLWESTRISPPSTAPEPADWPAVLVQLPLYNEPAVAGRLIAAAASMDYPPERLNIQVLDDSTEPGAITAVDEAVARVPNGIRIEVLRRANREGFKAGALTHGLHRNDAPFVVIFDADFVPPAEFLKRSIPMLYADDALGFVQARWSQLYRHAGMLQVAQAILLDAHFLREHAVRSARGLIFNFNGTAGIWRREAIEAAGGWQGDTLTEDFDLSYRARLAGWQGVFLPGLEAPAELPSSWGALCGQQARWTRGSLQCARKLLGPLWRSRLPWVVRAEATVPLLANLAWPLVLLMMILGFPVFAIRQDHGLHALAWVDAAFLLPATLTFLLYYWTTARRTGGGIVDATLAMLLGVALVLNNTRAALAGVFLGGGTFVRTPKTGEVDGAASAKSRGGASPPLFLLQAALLAYLLALAAFEAFLGVWIAMPFTIFFAAGTAWGVALSRGN